MKKIIVIDDEPNMLKFFKMFLGDLGHQVEVYPSAILCPLYNEDYPCDVLITDFWLPEVTGLEFIRHLRSEQRNVDKIAIMSGLWEKKAAREAEELGCNIFSKPFSSDDIINWLNESKIEPVNVSN